MCMYAYPVLLHVVLITWVRLYCLSRPAEEERMKVVEEVDEALEENFISLEKAKKSAKDGKEIASENDKTAETAEQNGVAETKAEVTDKIAENGVEMEEVDVINAGSDNQISEDSTKSDTGKTAAGDADATKEAAVKADSEGATDEAMEVDGGAPSKAAGDTTTTSASGDGKQCPWYDYETPAAAAGVAGDGAAQAEKARKDTAAVEGAVEDKPILPGDGTVSSKPEGKAATDEAKNASDESVDKCAESVKEPPADASGETEVKKATEPAASASAAVSAELEAEKAADGTTNGKATEVSASDEAKGVSDEGKVDPATETQSGPTEPTEEVVNNAKTAGEMSRRCCSAKSRLVA